MKRQSPLIERAKKRRWKLKNRICEFEGCGRMFTAITPRQRFCGSRLKKKGCSYLWYQSSSKRWAQKHRAQVRKWRKEWIAKHQDLRKAQQEATYWRHRARRLLKMKNYYKQNREKILEQRRMKKMGHMVLCVDQTARPFIPMV